MAAAVAGATAAVATLRQGLVSRPPSGLHSPDGSLLWQSYHIGGGQQMYVSR